MQFMEDTFCTASTGKQAVSWQVQSNADGTIIHVLGVRLLPGSVFTRLETEKLFYSPNGRRVLTSRLNGCDPRAIVACRMILLSNLKSEARSNGWSSAKQNKFSPKSELAGSLRPGRKLLCSVSAGWTSVLLQAYEQPGCVEQYESTPSPDPSSLSSLEAAMPWKASRMARGGKPYIAHTSEAQQRP